MSPDASHRSALFDRIPPKKLRVCDEALAGFLTYSAAAEVLHAQGRLPHEDPRYIVAAGKGPQAKLPPVPEVMKNIGMKATAILAHLPRDPPGSKDRSTRHLSTLCATLTRMSDTHQADKPPSHKEMFSLSRRSEDVAMLMLGRLAEPGKQTPQYLDCLSLLRSGAALSDHGVLSVRNARYNGLVTEMAIEQGLPSHEVIRGLLMDGKLLHNNMQAASAGTVYYQQARQGNFRAFFSQMQPLIKEGMNLVNPEVQPPGDRKSIVASLKAISAAPALETSMSKTDVNRLILASLADVGERLAINLTAPNEKGNLDYVRKSLLSQQLMACSFAAADRSLDLHIKSLEDPSLIAQNRAALLQPPKTAADTRETEIKEER